MQICPEWRKLPNAPQDAAVSTSTSSSTTSALLPPSSRWVRVRVFAAWAAMARPAEVEPVNDTTRTAGWSIMALPTGTPPGSICSTPSGRPASAKIRARTTPPHTAVRGSGLSSTALPRASAGATDRMDRISGKLNGEITATTPTGTRRSTLSRGCGVRSNSPWGAAVRAAASVHSPIAPWISMPALALVEPDSRTSHSTISSRCSSNRAAARCNTAIRSR